MSDRIMVMRAGKSAGIYSRRKRMPNHSSIYQPEQGQGVRPAAEEPVVEVNDKKWRLVRFDSAGCSFRIRNFHCLSDPGSGSLGFQRVLPDGRQYTNVLLQTSINGVLAIGLTFVILTRGIDLSRRLGSWHLLASSAPASPRPPPTAGVIGSP